MNENEILPDDPRLTAYALNEMEPAERGEFEKLLSADPAARQVVEDIRAASSLLETALAGEAAPEVEPAFAAERRRATLIRFPQFYYLVSGLAAACFALFFVIWQRNQPVGTARHYRAVELTTDSGAQAAHVEAAVQAEPAMRNESAGPAAFTAQVGSEQKAEATVERKAVETESADLVALAEAPVSRPAADAFSAAGNHAGDEGVVAALASGAVDSGYTAATTLTGSRISTEPPAGSGSGSSFQEDPVMERIVARGYVPTVSQASKPLTVWASRPAPPRLAPPLLDRVDGAFSTEGYAFRKDNDYVRVSDHPLSTFAVDVDTASYANVRRFLTQGKRPPVSAVRIEELVNYFPYAYAPPAADGAPFAASLEVASAPWASEHRLVRIGLKGREVSDEARPAANLVFLIDVSGSMSSSNKLPLLKQSLRLLVDRLRPDDRVAITVYASSSGLALPSTPVSRKADILEVVDALRAAGSTNGGMGIHLAYDIAKANFIPGGVNRVILATDGDFNVGTTSEGELVRLIGEKAKDGVFLTVLGFGMGNLKDGTLERIADQGNGHYAYIDSLAEARKTLVEQAGGTLVTIAKDVKIQVEFNPAQVAAYRLIGYENRLLAKEDFNNDAVDAGEIGAGHTVTALYEIVPAGVEVPGAAPAVDELKYQRPETGGGRAVVEGELLTVKLRYKEPAGEVSRRLEFSLRDGGVRFEDASQDFKFAAAVAAFGMALRDAPHKGSLTLADVAAWGRAGLGSDAGGYRSEFLGLVEKARTLQ